MFVQVFHGRLNDPELWASQVDVWRRDIRPRTTGFLGFTTGVTAASYMITVVRFESQDKARADSDLPEQGAWFEQSSKAFDGEITFHDCPEVDTLLAGGSDLAGFVQVMQGRTKDQRQHRALLQESQTQLHEVRPDLIGATVAWHGDGGFTQTSYFTSEREARANEQAMGRTPLFERLMAQVDGDLTFYDLTSPAFA